MNESIKEFICSFFQAEIEAKTASVKADLTVATEKISTLYNYCSEECFNNLGVVLPVSKESDLYYSKRASVQYIYPRHLYKISKYKNTELGEIWLCYCSAFLSNEITNNFKVMINCFIAKKITDNFQIIGEASRDYGYDETWDLAYGVEGLDFNNPGEFISTERYIEPSNDEISMKEWLEDK